MSRDYSSEYNLLAVSCAAAETAINTEGTLDTTLLVNDGDIINLDPRRETNSGRATGKEEPDLVYQTGNLSSVNLNFDMAEPQHFAFVFGFGLGDVASSAYGTGYKHLITPRLSKVLPGFTAAQRFGQTVMKRRFASMFIDQATATFAKDSWAKCVGQAKGTGKYAESVTSEEIAAAYNATSLTLAANGVQGATAGARLDSIHQVRVLNPSTGEYKDVTVTVVSGASPAVLTITAPGGVATSTTYEVIYAPTEAAWGTFPAIIEEPPLRVVDLSVTLGGKWTGSGTGFLGGKTIAEEVESIEYNLNNNEKIEFRPGGTGAYANYARREGRVQTIKLNRQLRDAILQMKLSSGEYFGVRAKCVGAEFEDGKNYYADFIWPRCAVMKSPISVSNKDNIEGGELQVLQDATYGSVIIEVANQVAAYAG
jgi:hypothetical protein